MKGKKIQVSETTTIKTLSMPIKLLNSSKFREAELMMEQYIQRHRDVGMAYLVSLGAKVSSAGLVQHKVGEGISVSEKVDNFLLYVTNRELFAKFLEYATPLEIKNALDFMLKYLTKYNEKAKVAKISKKELESVNALFGTLLDGAMTLDEELFANLSLEMGKCLLELHAFEMAKEYFENAMQNKEGESLFYLMFCALQVANEDEFIHSKKFSVELPEYLTLLMALENDADLYEKVVQLVEENQNQRMPGKKKKPQEAPAKSKKAKLATTKNQKAKPKTQKTAKPARPEINIKEAFQKRSKSPLTILGFVLFWLVTTASFVYLVFFYNEGAIWNAFVHLTPFARKLEGDKARLSLIVSTVLVGILQAGVFVIVIACRYKLIQRLKVYAICVPIVFSAWYIGYLLVKFPYYDEFSVVMGTILFFSAYLMVVGALVFGATGLYASIFCLSDIDFKSFRGDFFKRMYEKGFLAIPLLSSSIYMMLNGFSGVKFLNIVLCILFLIAGAMILYIGCKNKYLALFSVFNGETMPREDTKKAAKMEWITGTLLVSAAIILTLLFLLCGVELKIHIALDAVLLVYGLIQLVLGIAKECQLYQEAN